MSQEDIYINGELLRLRREARGWLLNDMAIRACMSVKQIRQLEEGGLSAFYSASVKATAAKKVGALLELSADEVFVQPVAPAVIEEIVDSEALINEVTVEHVQPPVAGASSAESERAHAEPVIADTAAVTSNVEDAPKSKTSLWVIAALFAAALAVAAYLQPRDEPVGEPAPPIQVLPTDTLDSASAASAADVPASAVTVPPASAPVLVRPASAPAVAIPSASSASQTP